FVQRTSFGRLCRKADRSRLNGGFGKDALPCSFYGRRGRKRALTKPTLSYMGHPDLSNCFWRVAQDFGLAPFIGGWTAAIFRFMGKHFIAAAVQRE
ncbi:MAG: hypothetical protein ABSC47_13760, partial [Terracidiphilus sp.]